MEIIPVPDLSFASCLSSVSWLDVHSFDLPVAFSALRCRYGTIINKIRNCISSRSFDCGLQAYGEEAGRLRLACAEKIMVSIAVLI